jgi:hypothetical protein
MSPKRVSLVDQDAWTDARSRRDRQVARSSAHNVGAISERQPWRHCGKPAWSTERPISTPRPALVLRESPAAQGRIKRARCVRSVGTGNTANSNDAANITNIRHNLSFLPMRCRCTAFNTLRRSRPCAAVISDQPTRKIKKTAAMRRSPGSQSVAGYPAGSLRRPLRHSATAKQ